MIQYSVAAVAAVIFHIAISVAIRRFGWVKENFRKDKIPAVFGLYIVAYDAIGAGLARYSAIGSDPAARLYLTTVLGFGLLGFIDDVFGSRDVGGFRGHFKKLILERRLTTGAAKALGGGLVAVYLGWRTSGGLYWLWVLDVMIIALSANTINLLDLRPGRALAVFFAGMIVAALAAWGRLSAPIPIAATMVSAAGVAYYDSSGRAMLGDVGSNALGAVLGLTLALDAPVVVKLVVMIVLLAANIYSERRPISALIARHPVLAGIDSKLGVR